MTTQINHTKISRLPVFTEEKELTKFLETNFTESLKNMIKLTVKTMIKTEMESFRKEFSDKLYFNGYYGRNMTSTFGRIEDIPVPRFRQSPNSMALQTTGVFAEEQHKFMKLIEQMHLLGISQRKIKYLARICFGIPISVNRVGAIYRELVEKEDININQKQLSDDYEYLILDGIYEKTKGYGWDDNRSVLLCALGVKPTGERQILGFSLARKEEIASWNPFVKSLKNRGLFGKNLKLVIADDHPAIKQAVDQYYPTIPIQLCMVHKERNVIGKTSHKNKKEIAEDLKIVFQSQTKDEAMEKAKQVVKKWYMTESKAMESFRFNLSSTPFFRQLFSIVLNDFHIGF